jgi:hypothetical protein
MDVVGASVDREKTRKSQRYAGLSPPLKNISL